MGTFFTQVSITVWLSHSDDFLSLLLLTLLWLDAIIRMETLESRDTTIAGLSSVEMFNPVIRILLFAIMVTTQEYMRERSRRGMKEITFIDLFCGCGGWTEGFMQVGYRCIYAVDSWSPAAITHSMNHPGIEDDETSKDILSDTVAARIKELLKQGKADILIGSPPCTQFSFSNRGGNGNTVEGMVLVRRFLEFVDYIQNTLGLTDFPWVMENVPRLKTFLEAEYVDGSDNMYRFNYVDRPDETFDIHIPQVVVLNSADYGAAQRRQRVFCGNFDIPQPTHIAPEILDDPASRRYFAEYHNMKTDDVSELRPWRTLRDILCSLPSPLEPRRAGQTVKDPNHNLTIDIDDLHDHFYDTRLSKGMELYECHELKQHHPVYGVMNFPDDIHQPARTVMATDMSVSRETIIIPVDWKDWTHDVGKRSYAKVLKEFGDGEASGLRRLTIREISCVQGFPITYQYSGTTRTTKHKQIGNAVSPFISRAFAKAFAKKFFPKRQRLKTGIDDILDIYRFQDMDGYPSFEHAHEWVPRNHIKVTKKFYRHLRTTKSDGQRIDIVYDERTGDKWGSMLCLGSGKAYKRFHIDQQLLEALSGSCRSSQLDLFSGQIDRLNTWKMEIDKKLGDAKLQGFQGFELNMCFNKNGAFKRWSPIGCVEEDIDKLIRQVVGRDYDSACSSSLELNLQEYAVRREINLYTVLAAYAAKRVVDYANIT